MKYPRLIQSSHYKAYNPDLTKRSQELRREMTGPEKKLWYEFLRNHRYRFVRQKPLDNYIVDFYCPKLVFVIELDGITHASKEAQEYDERRTRKLEEMNITVLRFSNDEVIYAFGQVCNSIDKYILEVESKS